MLNHTATAAANPCTAPGAGCRPQLLGHRRPQLSMRLHARLAPVWQRLALATTLALGSSLALGPAVAQPAASSKAATSRAANAAVQITGLDVQPAERLEPGADLVFTLWGTPGATASLDIAGVNRKVYLQELRSGVYEGVYTLSMRDRLAPDAVVTASLRRGNQLSQASLAEPLQQGWVPAPASAPVVGPLPEIRRFSISQDGYRRNPQRLLMRVDGTPGARVTVRLPGADTRRIRLQETSAGVYTGSYAIGAADRLRADADATAELRLGQQRVDTTLPRALSAVRLPAVAQAGAQAVALCSDCATVLVVNRLQVEGDKPPVGAVAGGVLGAVLGSQVGKGDGRTVAGVAGAVAGGVIGHQIDKRRNQREQFEVVLRMADGTQRTWMLDADPQLRAGATVRVVDGQIQAL